MMWIVCGCGNVKVEIENSLDLEVLQSELSPEEKYHPYFNKEVYKLTGNVSCVTEVHSQLVKNEIVGSWNICQCLICKAFTHGTNYVTGITTCSSSLKEEPADLKSFGLEKNISYSQVFHVWFPSHIDIPEDYLAHLPKCDIDDDESIEKIIKQADSFLAMAETKMQKSKIPVEKLEQSMEALKRRVKCEERYLHMLVLQSKNKNDLLQENVPNPHESSLQIQPNPCPIESARSIQYSSEETQTSENLRDSKQEDATTDDTLENLNCTMGSLDISNELRNAQEEAALPTESKRVQVSRSSLSYGIFEMDDIASSPKADVTLSDEEEEKTDEDEVFPEFSEDELYAKKFNAKDFARSVPLDVPSWPCAIDRYDREVDTKGPKNPQEIAATMRELARSVRTSSVDVFGELPRPNFASRAGGFVP